MTPTDLLAFESEIADLFSAGQIKAPVHLSGGNEQQLIDIFKTIGPEDWILCSWRSHYHCLLKGVPKDDLRDAILAGHSVSLSFPKYKILSSGIVGGIAPIAVGLGWSCKRRNDVVIGQQRKVHVFLGDMTAMAGIVQESINYCIGHDLPIRWVIEDNGVSVCTDTEAVWGPPLTPEMDWYEYKLTRPHCGVGQWVRF